MHMTDTASGGPNDVTGAHASYRSLVLAHSGTVWKSLDTVIAGTVIIGPAPRQRLSSAHEQ